VALLGIGVMVNHFVEAAPLIEEALGHPVTVVDARFIKPLDRALILSLAAEHELLFTCEDNTVRGGFGSAVNELLVEEGAANRAQVFGLPDAFVEHGQPRELYGELGLLPHQLAAKIIARVNGRA
jgi:1-deoxy-D-xylulose-5-phosphate synthase